MRVPRYLVLLACLLFPLLTSVLARAAVHDLGQPAMAASGTGWTATAYEDHPTPGQPAGTQVRVRQTHNGAQVRDVTVSDGGSVAGFAHTQPAVGVADNGDTVVAWSEDSDGNGAHDIAVRVLRSDGTMSAVVSANGPDEYTGDQVRPALSVRPDGSFVVAWEDRPTGGTVTVHAAGYASITTRTFGPVRVNTGNGATKPAIAATAAGAVVAWEQNTDIYYASLSGTGAVKAAGAPADSDAKLNHLSPAVAALPGGDFVVAWSGNMDGAWRIRLRGFKADLSQRFAEKAAAPADTKAQADPVAGMDGTGGFVLGWNEQTAADDIDAYVAGFNSDGSTAGRLPLQRINPTTAGLQGHVAVGVAPDATVGVAYENAPTLSGGARTVETRLGLGNLTAPGTTMAGALTDWGGPVPTMTYDDSDLAKVKAAEAANPALAPQPVSAVLDSANGTARPLCHATYSTPAAAGFCWNDAYGDDSGMEYVPQGITQAVVGGRKLMLMSWHSGSAHPTQHGEGLVRVTFADVTDPAHVTYRHALLVVPSGNGVFAQEDGHADALVLSGNYLYLAHEDATAVVDGFDVFDLRHIWKMNGDSQVVGEQSDGTFSANWHLWALPRVAKFQYQGRGCGTYADSPPCITAAALDTSGSVPSIVTTEGVDHSDPSDFPNHRAAIVRWAIDPATGLLSRSPDGVAHATAMLTSRIPGTQGVVSYNGKYVLAGPCPEFVPGMYNIPSCLYTTSTSGSTTLWTRGAVNLENLVYDPAIDQVWTLNESPGVRVVYHLAWPF